MKTDPAAQCRFFKAEDACRIALQAYYAAGRRIEPPPGEPWMVDGDPYASAADFADAFSGEVQARIALLALDRLGNFDVAMSEWNLYKLAADIAPEKMAPIIAERETMLADINASFLETTAHGLPCGDNRVDNATVGGDS